MCIKGKSKKQCGTDDVALERVLEEFVDLKDGNERSHPARMAAH